MIRGFPPGVLRRRDPEVFGWIGGFDDKMIFGIARVRRRAEEMNTMNRVRFSTLLFVQAVVASTVGRAGEPSELRKATVAPRVELHYLERGKGVAVIFIHGSLGDYSAWDGQLGPFAEGYRAIAYSRRYNYPNTTTLQPNHSAVVDAADLASLIKKLNLGKVHLIGHSYGGYAALFVAVNHPELVRTLVLAEPPLVFAGDRVNTVKERRILPRERRSRRVIRKTPSGLLSTRRAKERTIGYRNHSVSDCCEMPRN